MGYYIKEFSALFKVLLYSTLIILVDFILTIIPTSSYYYIDFQHLIYFRNSSTNFFFFYISEELNLSYLNTFKFLIYLKKKNN